TGRERGCGQALHGSALFRLLHREKAFLPNRFSTRQHLGGLNSKTTPYPRIDLIRSARKSCSITLYPMLPGRTTLYARLPSRTIRIRPTSESTVILVRSNGSLPGIRISAMTIRQSHHYPMAAAV